MANQAQVAVLKEGREAWERWRREHPDMIADGTLFLLSHTERMRSRPTTGESEKGARDEASVYGVTHTRSRDLE